MHKTIKMPRALGEAWLADLRNPDNKDLQGKCRLQTTDGKFCCLGRLQIVADGQVEMVRGVGREEYKALPTKNWLEAHGIMFSDLNVQSDGRRWDTTSPTLCRASERPEVDNEADYHSADALNDNDVPFAEIADLIERQMIYTD